MPRRKEVSDAEIVRAARKVFLEQGTQVPVAIVARELGVSPATLFVRMGTKEKLISAALWPPDPQVFAVLERALDSRPVARQLVDILVDIARYTDAEIPATFTKYAAGLRPDPTTEDFSDIAPRRLRRELARWLREAVRAGKVDCDPRVAAEVFVGTLEARAMHVFLGKTAVTDRDTRVFVRSLIASVLRVR